MEKSFLSVISMASIFGNSTSSQYSKASILSTRSYTASRVGLSQEFNHPILSRDYYGRTSSSSYIKTSRYTFDNTVHRRVQNVLRNGQASRIHQNPGSRRNYFSQGNNSNHIILDWNATMLQAIAAEKTAPPLAARNMAIVQVAVYDAVNSILGMGRSLMARVNAPAWASAEAAASMAAYKTLVHLFPAQKASFDAAFAVSDAKVRNGITERTGWSVGAQIADRVLSLRANDGANLKVTYTPQSGPGFWQSTALGSPQPALPQWPNVQPFALHYGAQFRSTIVPPAYTSPQFISELEEVRGLGSINSVTRTADQTQIALFWADGAGTFTPPGHWNDIAAQVARSRQTDLFTDAQLFATLNVALADAGIAAWDAKYSYNQWRPINALRDTTPGLGWTPDPTWTPLITTPNFPDTISGHSTFSAAAGTVLGAFFGNNTAFTASASPASAVPGVTRSYESFSQAVAEAGRSRIYGGIHWESSNQDGQRTGQNIGNYVIRSFWT